MKPNWRLIAVLSAAVVTIGVIVLMFVSTRAGVQGSGLPTATALSKIGSNSVEKNLKVTIGDNGCVFVDVDGTKSLAIWPKGFSQDAKNNVVTDDGTTYGQGGAFLADTIVTDRKAVVASSGGGDSGYLGTLITHCQGNDTHVAIIVRITG